MFFRRRFLAALLLGASISCRLLAQTPDVIIVFKGPGFLQSGPATQARRLSGNTASISNDDWGGDAQLTAAFASAGAFPISANSRDSAVLVTLPPGSYTAQVSGVNNTTGIALVEVYELP